MLIQSTLFSQAQLSENSQPQNHSISQHSQIKMHYKEKTTFCKATRQVLRLVYVAISHLAQELKRCHKVKNSLRSLQPHNNYLKTSKSTTRLRNLNLIPFHDNSVIANQKKKYNLLFLNSLTRVQLRLSFH